MKKIVLICTFLGFFCCAIKAQISTNELPYSWERGISQKTIQSMPVVTMPFLHMETIQREDREREASNVAVPYRFGFSHEVNLSMDNSGVWETTSDGGRLWTLRLHSPDALSLNLLYDKFYVPEGAKFFLYSEDRTQHIGAFTSRNNQGNRENITGFATGLLFTNSIVLEYYEPEDAKNSGIISISHVISGYRNIQDFINTGGNNMQFTCHNDITCPIGDDYRQERNAVALIVVGGQYWCTGALLNTTANDNSPMFLTANHCFVPRPNVNQWVFHWHYEAPCGGNAPSPFRTTTGANLLARWANTDFALLRLIEDPAEHPNVTPYYLGWNRATTSAPRGAVIHHPQGSPKKISTTNRSIVSHTSSITWAYPNPPGGTFATPANHLWNALLTNGTLEGGSSGAPLLDQNRRVIGQHVGGGRACPTPTNPTVATYNGRFDRSWTGGGTNTTRLSNWLAPGLSNPPQTLNGRAGRSISGANIICNGSSANFSVNNWLSGFRWEVSHNLRINGVNTNSSVSITATGNGSAGWVRVMSGTMEIARREIWVGVPDISLNSNRVEGPVNLVVGQVGAYSVSHSHPPLPHATIKWATTGQSTITSNHQLANVTFWQVGSYQISAAVSNECGSTFAAFTNVNVVRGDGNEPPVTCNCNPSWGCSCIIFGPMVHPNPVSDILNIEIGTTNTRIPFRADIVISDNIYEIRLYNDRGNLVRQMTTRGGKMQFNVSNLPTGVYSLHIHDGVSCSPDIRQIIIRR